MDTRMNKLHKPINWNKIDDEMDLVIWNKLTSQFWLPEAFPVSNDLPSWRKMTEAEQWLVMRVFTGLTMLDTLQGEIGAISLMDDAVTQHEKAVYTNIAFMEEVHARSYSTIFQTLAPSDQIERAYRWADDNDQLQAKANIVMAYYEGADPLKKKVASTLLESFLFYSGFYLPLYLNGHAKLTNTADIIRTIMKDEAIHGFYIGYKFQRGFALLSDDEKDDLTDWAYDLLTELYDNEVKYTQDLYDEHGLTEDVKRFLRYNANKALMNLGFDPLFPKEDINPIILNGLSLEGVTHDFFSQKGNYSMATVKQMNDEDFSAMRKLAATDTWPVGKSNTVIWD